MQDVLSPLQYAIYKALVKTKMTIPDMAREVGSTPGSVKTELGRIRDKGYQIQSKRRGPHDVKDYWMVERDFEDRPRYKKEYESEEEFGEDIFGSMADLTEVLTHDFLPSERTFELGDKPVAMIFPSDTHVAQPHSHIKLVKHLFHEVIPKTPRLYAGLLGDLIDNSNSAFSPRGTFSTLNLNQQLALIRYLLKPMKDAERILFAVEGNHEGRTYKGEQFSITQYLAKSIGALFGRNGGIFEVDVGGHKTSIYARHELPGNSQFNPLHGNVRAALFKTSPIAGHADVIVGAHIHESAVGEWMVGPKMRTMIISGNTVLYDEYADRMGFYPGVSSFPILILMPDGSRFVHRRTYEGIELFKTICKNWKK